MELESLPPPKRQKVEVQTEMLAMDTEAILEEVGDLWKDLLDYATRDKHHQNQVKELEATILKVTRQTARLFENSQ